MEAGVESCDLRWSFVIGRHRNGYVDAFSIAEAGGTNYPKTLDFPPRIRLRQGSGIDRLARQFPREERSDPCPFRFRDRLRLPAAELPAVHRARPREPNRHQLSEVTEG